MITIASVAGVLADIANARLMRCVDNPVDMV